MSEKQQNINVEVDSHSELKTEDTPKHHQSSRDKNSDPVRQENLHLGLYLKNIREEHDISIKQLSIDTKINESVLANLETENFEKLPRKIYLKGFIKTYCDYFKINPKTAIQILDQVFEQGDPITDVKGRFENHQGTKVSTRSIFVVAIIGLGIIISLFLIKKFFFSATKIVNPEIITEKIDYSTPLVGSPSNIELSQESTDIKDEDIENQTASNNNELRQKLKKDKLKEPIENQEEGDQLPTEVGFKKFPENYLSYMSTSLDEIKKFIPPSILNPNKNVSEKVIIFAENDKTWIAYQKDNEDIKQLILKEDKVLVISGNDVRLVIGNSNSVRLIHNKKEVNINSKTGIKSLVFPKNSAKKYQLPLFYRDINGDYISSGTIN